MRNKIHLLIIGLFLCTSIGFAQAPAILKLDSLLKKFPSQDTVYVINFWATWCKPCVEEFPLFTELDQKAKERNWKVKVLMVSMDFAEDYKSKLLPFLEKHPTGAEIVLLDENNADYFIPKIDSAWTGTLPFTLVINYKGEKGVRFSVEGPVTWDELLQFTTN
ncbi:MAG: TlpA family protein disulfide reductase [Bacteroidia bacterium]|nr:TlpA family protein disulfide reductase [Bacteroidia bacterium]